MDLYINLSHYGLGELKNVLLYVNPDEKLLVKDVIEYICAIFSISSSNTIALFKDEWFIYPNQPSEILKEKGILILKDTPITKKLSLETCSENTASNICIRKKKKCKKKKISERSLNDQLIHDSPMMISKEKKSRPISEEENKTMDITEEEIYVKKKKSKKSKRSSSVAPQNESLCEPPQSPYLSHLESSICESPLENKINSNVSNSVNLLKNNNNNEEIEVPVCEKPDEIDWNDPESYLKIKPKRKRKHNKALKKLKNESTSTAAINYEYVEPVNKKSKWDIGPDINKSESNKNTEKSSKKDKKIDSNSYQNKITENQEITETTVTKSAKKKISNADYILGCPLSEDLVLNEIISAKYCNILELEGSDRVNVYNRRVAQDKPKKAEIDKKLQILPRKIPTGPPEPSEIHPSDETTSKFSSLLACENKKQLSMFCRKELYSSTNDKFFIDAANYNGLPLSFGSGKFKMEPNFSYQYKSKSVSKTSNSTYAELDIKNNSSSQDHSDGKEMTNSPLLSGNFSSVNDSPVRSICKDSSFVAPIKKSISPDEGLNDSKISSDMSKENKVSVSSDDDHESNLKPEEILDDEVVTPTFCGAAPAKKRNNRHYLSIGNILRSLKDGRVDLNPSKLTNHSESTDIDSPQDDLQPEITHCHINQSTKAKYEKSIKNDTKENHLISREIKQELIDRDISSTEQSTGDSIYENCPLLPNLPTVGDNIAIKIMSVDELMCPCYSDYKAAKVLNMDGLKLTLKFEEDEASDSSIFDWRDLINVRLISS